AGPDDDHGNGQHEGDDEGDPIRLDVEQDRQNPDHRCRRNLASALMSLQWKPAQPLSRVALEGELVRLEPVDVARHAGQLFAAQSGAPELWEYLPYGPFESETAFGAWLTERAATADPLVHAIVDGTS